MMTFKKRTFGSAANTPRRYTHPGNDPNVQLRKDVEHLFMVEKMDAKQIADELGKNPGTIRCMITRLGLKRE